MVEINNQHEAFLDMLAWSEGTMAPGRRKTRNVVTLTSLQQAKLMPDCSINLTGNALFKDSINKRRTRWLLSR